jgi:hypothetical protein
LFGYKKPFIVGLVSSPDRIVEIRKQRLSGLGQDRTTPYVNQDEVREEMLSAKRLFAKNRWPVVDTTRRSIEESAARIINLYQDFKKKNHGDPS